MSLLTHVVDDFIDGKIGNGKVITRQEVINRYKGKYSDTYLASILYHSRFTQNVRKGEYRVDKKLIELQEKERVSKTQAKNIKRENGNRTKEGQRLPSLYVPIKPNGFYLITQKTLNVKDQGNALSRYWGVIIKYFELLL